MRFSPGCGCCGATVPCCPGAVPTVVHLTVTTSGNGCCLGGPDGTYTLTYNAGTQTWIGQGVGGDGFVYQWLLSACTSGLDSFYLSSGYVAGSHSPGPGLGCDAWFHNQMAVASCSPFHLTGSFVLGNASTACPCYCPSSGGFTTLNCDVTA